MPEKSTALRRRIAPSVPLEISFSDEKGNFTQIYRVAFNLNVLAEISERTGIEALGLDLWRNFDAKRLLVMVWAALLPNHPEFDTRDRKGQRTDEGLETVGSWPWIGEENQLRAIRALWDAYLLYLPKDQAELLRKEREKAEKEAEAGSASSGGEPPLESKGPDSSNSGPSPDTISEFPIAKSAN